jgi:predicted RNA-binding Zn-ribbon protein involved in translation (DUF1610 family)
MESSLNLCEKCGVLPELKSDNADDPVHPRKKIYRYKCPKCGRVGYWDATSARQAVKEWNHQQKEAEDMVKKSFKDDPALDFISTPTETTREKEDKPETPAPKCKAPKATVKPEPKAKTFKIKIDGQGGWTEETIHGIIETKNRRVNLLITPSLYDKVRAHAERRRLSVNELIGSILESYTEEAQ